jgi:hypothetical protein
LSAAFEPNTHILDTPAARPIIRQPIGYPPLPQQPQIYNPAAQQPVQQQTNYAPYGQQVVQYPPVDGAFTNQVEEGLCWPALTL